MTTKTILASALVASSAVIIGFAVGDADAPTLKIKEGYTRFNPTAQEADIQKTLVNAEGEKFTIARHLIRINELDEQLAGIIDEDCTKLGCTEVCTTDEEGNEACSLPEGCEKQIACEAQITANAEQRQSTTDQKNQLLADIISAKEELKLDISNNPYNYQKNE